MQLRDALAESSRVSFTAELICDDGDCVSEYEIACVRSKGITEVMLLSPQLIAGVSAKISENSAAISYDGLSLDVGAFSESGLTPMGAPSMILDAIGKGVISQIRSESDDGGEHVYFCVDCGGDRTVNISMAADAIRPEYAEILLSGRAAVCCTISDWNME